MESEIEAKGMMKSEIGAKGMMKIIYKMKREWKRWKGSEKIMEKKKDINIILVTENNWIKQQEKWVLP